MEKGCRSVRTGLVSDFLRELQPFATGRDATVVQMLGNDSPKQRAKKQFGLTFGRHILVLIGSEILVGRGVMSLVRCVWFNGPAFRVM